MIPSLENHPKIKLRLHITLGVFLVLIFIFVIARLANPGTPPNRSSTWGIAVTIKSALFLAYQLCTEHVERFEKWASPKANMILNMIDTVFWFVLFVITIKATAGACSGSSCPLGGVVATLAFILCCLAVFLSFICVRDWRYYKVYGVLPGTVKIPIHH
ncbi:hypothetical protein HFD88_005351 [Aspergillus terreus]|nr:hypothetical protein HFD88_005351 [Aspergillus terreus]